MGNAQPVNTTWGEVLLNRVSVIVQLNNSGQLEVMCGYRGAPAAAGYANLGALDQSMNDNAALEANSGQPIQAYYMCTPAGVETSGAAVNAHRLKHPDVNNWLAYVSDAHPTNGANQVGMRIVACGFVGLSVRMQMLLGAGAENEVISDDVGNYAERKRGRVLIKSHQTNNAPLAFSGLARYTGAVQPNLDPPSFMYLQMTVPGTRSKILGMSDERGGWAVPTAPIPPFSGRILISAGLRESQMGSRISSVRRLQRHTWRVLLR